MKRVAQVGVKAAVVRPARRELGDDECSQNRNRSAGDPEADDGAWDRDDFSDDRRIAEDSRADDAAHHDERRIERAKPPGERG